MSAPDLREVYRDDYVLVVDKPAGMPSQRTEAGEPGVYEQLCAQHTYVGLHHRLDRRASGLLVLALHPDANAPLAASFREHAVERTYHALCEGTVEAGSWGWPIGEQEARTDLEVLARHVGLTEVRCRLHTGRTHQIRIHAAMNGTPLAGDTRYGGDLSRPWHRLCLHAGGLSFTHPTTGEVLTFEAPLPEYYWPPQ